MGGCGKVRLSHAPRSSFKADCPGPLGVVWAETQLLKLSALGDAWLLELTPFLHVCPGWTAQEGPPFVTVTNPMAAPCCEGGRSRKEGRRGSKGATEESGGLENGEEQPGEGSGVEERWGSVGGRP